MLRLVKKLANLAYLKNDVVLVFFISHSFLHLGTVWRCSPLILGSLSLMSPLSEFSFSAKLSLFRIADLHAGRPCCLDTPLSFVLNYDGQRSPETTFHCQDDFDGLAGNKNRKLGQD
ncbi:hypothetical protein I3842_12G026300 [Carya illinoinensis]|uniref:Uncharacterized protein n=1 Tax=Carya illinoinensis TaxID=32201 RepID=A0A922IUR0_CARIL|nr:hypothetical protein I3842_12G026300 [Carya illinoinensis]